MEFKNPEKALQDSHLHTQIETQEKEIERLNEEVKKLRKCVRGVNVLGRALKETKKENERLLQSSMSEEHATDVDNPSDPRSMRSIISTTQNSETNDSENQTSFQNMEASGKVSSIDDMESIDEFPDDDGRNQSVTDIDEISELPHKSQDIEKVENELNERDKKDEEKTDDSVKMNVDDNETNLLKILNISSPDVVLKQLKDDTTPIENVAQAVPANNDGASNLQTNKRTPTEPQNDTNDAPEIISNVKDRENITHREMNQGNANNHTVSETDNVDLKSRCEVLTKENAKLKLEFKKVLKVNNEWESFWRTKNSCITKDMNEKDAIIAELQKFKSEHETCVKDDASKKDKKVDAKKNETKEMEKTLLTKEHVNELKVLNERQRKELTEERHKYERTQKLARSLLQQNKELSEEVKRLNGTLQTKTELYKSLQLSIASGSLHNGSINEDQMVDPSTTDTVTRLQEQTHMLRSGLVEYTEEHRQRQGNELPQKALNDEAQQPKQQLEQQIVSDGDSLSAEELKERIMLLKEQKNAYESDFRKERRDREDVVGELERTKERLERAKQKVKQKKSNRGHCPPFSNYVEVQTAGRNQPAAYLHPPNERNRLVAHGVQQRVPHHNDWYGYPDQPIIVGQNGDPPCFCPRHHHHRP